LNEREIDTLLDQLPVGKVWGVGGRLAVNLGAMGITTVRQLKQADPRQIKRKFSVVLERTVAELNGISCLELEDVVPPRQQMVASRSFGEKVRDLATLTAAVSHHVARAAEKLRTQKCSARLVGVSIRTSPFVEEPQHHPYIVVPLVYPTDDTIVLTQAALAGLRQIYRKGFRYQKAGVILMELGPRDVQQTDLFAPPPDPRRRKLMRVMDAINRQYGSSCVKLGAEGLTRNWTMRQDQRSPCWTTRWEDLPLVK
jgi:DNA polymerase V